MIRVTFAIAALGFITACQSATTAAPAPTQAETPIAGPTAISNVPASGLGPQELADGACGLFLWSQTDISKFIFFSEALSGQAIYARVEVPLQLTQTGAGGDIFGQFTTRTRFESADGVKLALEITPGEDLEGGQRIESGLITLTDTEGWVTKLPVLGVRACKPDA